MGVGGVVFGDLLKGTTAGPSRYQSTLDILGLVGDLNQRPYGSQSKPLLTI